VVAGGGVVVGGGVVAGGGVEVAVGTGVVGVGVVEVTGVVGAGVVVDVLEVQPPKAAIMAMINTMIKVENTCLLKKPRLCLILISH
jgi:hypothetical protein